jgi:hypothetical protein
MCIKTLAAHREAGPLLRELLHLPLPQLQVLVKVAPSVVEPLSRLVQAMSEQELQTALQPFTEAPEPAVALQDEQDATAQEPAVKTEQRDAAEMKEDINERVTQIRTLIGLPRSS